MADLNAAKVLERLGSLGSDFEPKKQAYKAEIAGKTVTLYDANGSAIDLRAENIEHYVGKGFSVSPPAPEVADVTPEQAEPELAGTRRKGR